MAENNLWCFECDKGPSPDGIGNKCACGRFYKLNFSPAKTKEFVPFYCTVLRSWVSSLHDQEVKMKNHRSYSHQDGLVAIQDDKKWMAELKNIRKNREDYIKSTRPGYKYGESKLGQFQADRPDRFRTGKRIYSYAK